jgi:hypothetical protein
MSSRNCLLKLQASIATQSQILLDLDIIATQATIIARTTRPVITTPPAAPVQIVTQVDVRRDGCVFWCGGGLSQPII